MFLCQYTGIFKLFARLLDDKEIRVRPIIPFPGGGENNDDGIMHAVSFRTAALALKNFTRKLLILQLNSLLKLEFTQCKYIINYTIFFY
jgi:hypothetical protein